MIKSFDRFLEIEREMKANNVQPFDNGMYCLAATKELLISLLPESMEDWLTEEMEYSHEDMYSINQAQALLLIQQGKYSFVGFVGNLMIFTKD